MEKFVDGCIALHSGNFQDIPDKMWMPHGMLAVSFAGCPVGAQLVWPTPMGPVEVLPHEPGMMQDRLYLQLPKQPCAYQSHAIPVFQSVQTTLPTGALVPSYINGDRALCNFVRDCLNDFLSRHGIAAITITAPTYVIAAMLATGDGVAGSSGGLCLAYGCGVYDTSRVHAHHCPTHQDAIRLEAPGTKYDFLTPSHLIPNSILRVFPSNGIGGAPSTGAVAGGSAPVQAFKDLYSGRPTEGRVKACECGSDAVKAPAHSSWCPKA